jgi:hypothetical protein
MSRPDMTNSRKIRDSARFLEKRYRVMADLLLLIGLTVWVVLDPPPQSWLPLAILSVAVLTMSIRAYFKRRFPSSRPDRPA